MSYSIFYHFLYVSRISPFFSSLPSLFLSPFFIRHNCIHRRMEALLLLSLLLLSMRWLSGDLWRRTCSSISNPMTATIVVCTHFLEKQVLRIQQLLNLFFHSFIPLVQVIELVLTLLWRHIEPLLHHSPRSLLLPHWIGPFGPSFIIDVIHRHYQQPHHGVCPLYSLPR